MVRRLSNVEASMSLKTRKSKPKKAKDVAQRTRRKDDAGAVKKAKTAKKAKTTKKIPGHERIREILEVSQKLFLSHGVENVSTRLIANAVGISQPALYKHFVSKQEILDQLVDHAFEELTQVIGSLNQERERWIEQAIAEYIRFGLKHPDEYRLALLSVRRPRDSAKADVVQSQRQRRTSFRLLEARVRAGMEAGWIRRDIGSSVSVAQCLWSAMHGVVTLLITRPNFPWEDSEKLIAVQTRILLRGILTENESIAPS